MSDSVTLWTVAHQAPLFMGFSRHGYWSGLLFPPPGDLPDLGTEAESPALTGRFFTMESPGKPLNEFVVVIQPLCLILCDPMDCSTPGLLVPHHFPSLLKLLSIESVVPSNHLVLCCPLLLLPSVFPSIRVFSSESVLLIWWPKYRSFSFSISPSNEYSGLISFRINWLDLAV